MPNTEADMKKYVVVRAFHLGEANLNLAVGESVQFDGHTVLIEKTNATHAAPSFRLATLAGHAVEDDGTVTFEKPKPVERPTPNVIVEDHEDMVVAQINLPNEVKADGTTRQMKSTEETAKAASAPPRVIVDEQRVVAPAGRDARRGQGPRAAVVSDAEAAETAAEQQADAKVVTAGTKDRVKELLAAEGITNDPVGSTPVVVDGDEGVVVGKVKSYEEREAELKENARKGRITAADLQTTPEEQAALAADIELAKAKREGRVVTASQAPNIETQDNGYPAGFPHNDHWVRRMKWCEGNADNAAALKLVYDLSTDAFKNRMKQNFPTIDFG